MAQGGVPPVTAVPMPFQEGGQPVVTSTLKQAFMMEESWQGPLPPPKMLEAFEKVEKGFANRIVAMAEGEAKHIRRMELLHLLLAAGSRYFGQFAGMALAALALYVGWDLVLKGHQVPGCVLFGTTISVVVTAFALGKRSKAAENGSKDQQPPSGD